MENDLKKCIEVLKAGGIILYPTDTIWGLGCDATNEQAVSKIFEIKKRDDSKSLITLVDSSSMLCRYVKDIPDAANQILDVAVEPLTIIYPHGINLAKNVIAQDNSVAIRICNDDFCKKLIYTFKKPIVSTSANISNDKTPRYFYEITKNIISKADYVVKYRQDEKHTVAKPSGIIKVGMDGEIEIIRKY